MGYVWLESLFLGWLVIVLKILADSSPRLCSNDGTRIRKEVGKLKKRPTPCSSQGTLATKILRLILLFPTSNFSEVDPQGYNNLVCPTTRKNRRDTSNHSNEASNLM